MEKMKEHPDRLLRMLLSGMRTAYIADHRYDYSGREKAMAEVSRAGHALLAQMENGGYAPCVRSVLAAFLKETKDDAREDS